jgi:hypothetical protein
MDETLQSVTQSQEGYNQGDKEIQKSEFVLGHLFSAAVALRIAHLPSLTEKEKSAGRQSTVTDLLSKYESSELSDNKEPVSELKLAMVSEMRTLLQKHLSDIKQLEDHHDIGKATYAESFFM